MNNGWNMLRAVISLIESIVIIASLGFYDPGWSYDFSFWNLKRGMEKRRARSDRNSRSEV